MEKNYEYLIDVGYAGGAIETLFSVEYELRLWIRVPVVVPTLCEVTGQKIDKPFVFVASGACSDLKY
jgi:hypothetical protein